MLTTILILAVVISIYSLVLTSMLVAIAVNDSKTPGEVFTIAGVAIVLSVFSIAGLGYAIAVVNR